MFGVVIADSCEFSPFANFAATQKNFKEGTDKGNKFVEFETNFHCKVKVLHSGIGKVNAAQATSFLISEGAKVIFNVGMSGSLMGLPESNLVIAESAFEADFDLTPLGYKEFAKPEQIYVYETDERLLTAAKSVLLNARVGKIACGDLFLTDAKRGKYLNENYGVVAFDMESGAVASVCYKCEVPFLAIRQISDSADENAAETYTGNNELCKDDLLTALMKVMKTYNEVTTK